MKNRGRRGRERERAEYGMCGAKGDGDAPVEGGRGQWMSNEKSNEAERAESEESRRKRGSPIDQREEDAPRMELRQREGRPKETLHDA